MSVRRQLLSTWFLPLFSDPVFRHGRRHNIYPSAVNYRANIYALKAEGCTHVLATTACGSLREEMPPGDFVLVDQFIDRLVQFS